MALVLVDSCSGRSVKNDRSVSLLDPELVWAVAGGAWALLAGHQAAHFPRISYGYSGLSLQNVLLEVYLVV